MFEKIKLDPLNQFYPVNLAEIRNSESKLGIQIPKLLKEFYLVNDFLPDDSQVDISLQSILLREGIKDVKNMIKIFQEYGREHPTEMWLVYDAQKNSLDSHYSYEERYDKDEELLPRLEFEKWFEEVKRSTQAEW